MGIDLTLCAGSLGPRPVELVAVRRPNGWRKKKTRYKGKQMPKHTQLAETVGAKSSNKVGALLVDAVSAVDAASISLLI